MTLNIKLGPRYVFNMHWLFTSTTTIRVDALIHGSSLFQVTTKSVGCLPPWSRSPLSGETRGDDITQSWVGGEMPGAQGSGQLDIYELALFIVSVYSFIFDQKLKIHVWFTLPCRRLLMRYQTLFDIWQEDWELPPVLQHTQANGRLKSLRFLSQTWCIQNIPFLFKYYFTSIKGVKVVKIFQLSSTIHWRDETRTLQMTTKPPSQLLRH